MVLDDGEIAGIGTHEELFDSCQVYREICLSQQSGERENGKMKVTVVLKRILSYTRPYLWFLIGALLCALLNVALTLLARCW